MLFVSVRCPHKYRISLFAKNTSLFKVFTSKNEMLSEICYRYAKINNLSSILTFLRFWLVLKSTPMLLRSIIIPGYNLQHAGLDLFLFTHLSIPFSQSLLYCMFQLFMVFTWYLTAQKQSPKNTNINTRNKHVPIESCNKLQILLKPYN